MSIAFYVVLTLIEVIMASPAYSNSEATSRRIPIDKSYELKIGTELGTAIAGKFIIASGVVEGAHPMTPAQPPIRHLFERQVSVRVNSVFWGSLDENLVNLSVNESNYYQMNFQAEPVIVIGQEVLAIIKEVSGGSGRTHLTVGFITESEIRASVGTIISWHKRTFVDNRLDIATVVEEIISLSNQSNMFLGYINTALLFLDDESFGGGSARVDILLQLIDDVRVPRHGRVQSIVTISRLFRMRSRIPGSRSARAVGTLINAACSQELGQTAIRLLVELVEDGTIKLNQSVIGDRRECLVENYYRADNIQKHRDSEFLRQLNSTP